MAMGLMQQGSKGAMRDLDYINPRPPKQSSALPPEVRARLLGRKGGKGGEGEAPPRPEVYQGSAMAAPKVGQSGAGTNWQNPNGHAFIRRGSGVPMSKRASRHAQMGYGSSEAMIAAQSQQPPLAPAASPAGGYGGRAGSNDRPPAPPQDLRPSTRESQSAPGGRGEPPRQAKGPSAALAGGARARSATPERGIARQKPPPMRMESLGNEDAP